MPDTPPTEPAAISEAGIGLTRTTIDATPTWSAVLDLLLDAATSGSSSVARAELRRMAELADRYVALRASIVHSPTTSKKDPQS